MPPIPSGCGRSRAKISRAKLRFACYYELDATMNLRLRQLERMCCPAPALWCKRTRPLRLDLRPTHAGLATRMLLAEIPERGLSEMIFHHLSGQPLAQFSEPGSDASAVSLAIHLSRPRLMLVSKTTRFIGSGDRFCWSAHVGRPQPRRRSGAW